MIDSVTVCYRGFNYDNYISRIALDEMLLPTNPVIMHEEEVYLTGNFEACHTSIVGGIPINGTVTLALEFVFIDIYDTMFIGAIGIHVSEPMSTVGGGGDYVITPQSTLLQNRPNPFGRRTDIEYSLEQSDEVSIDVLDVAGRVVRTLFREQQSQGEYHVSWDGTDDLGNAMPSGKYFYRLRVGEETTARGMLMLR